ncbi:MAG: hypothetical protein R3B96_16495 [Pirellulaceae bacterium]
MPAATRVALHGLSERLDQGQQRLSIEFGEFLGRLHSARDEDLSIVSTQIRHSTDKLGLMLPGAKQLRRD